MGDIISSCRDKVVPTLIEDHLAIIKDQNPNNTCVVMSICYLLYVFLVKYYVKQGQQLKDLGAYNPTSEGQQEDIQKYLMQYLVDAYHNSQPLTTVDLDDVGPMFTTVANIFKCDVAKEDKISWDVLKAFLKKHNTIHACIIICQPCTELSKFFKFFRDENTKNNELTKNMLNSIQAQSNFNIGHAMVCVQCYQQDQTNKNMIKGANSWGETFGNKGYFRVEYDLLKYYDPIFTFERKQRKPNEFEFPKVGNAKARTVTASDLIGNAIRVKVPWNFTVGQIKEAIANQVGVKASNIDLIYREKVVTDDMTADDIDYNPIVHFRIFYHSYDNSKQKVTLDGKNLSIPNIYTLHGANPLTHKVFYGKHALALMVHNPKKKTVSYYGPFYNVPDSYNCNEINELLKKNHNLSFNFSGGVFFKANPYKKEWMKIMPNFSLRNQLKFLPSTSYIVLNVQQ